MKHAANLGALLMLCMVSLFFTQPDIRYVLAFLCALILCCLSLADLHSGLLTAGCLLDCAAAVFLPEFLFFYPLSFYVLCLAGRSENSCAESRSLYRFRSLLPLASAALFLLLAGPVYSLPAYLVFLGLFGFLAAFLLEQLASRTGQMEEQLKRTQDDSAERSILLTEKNRSLLEKQDYEIYAATLRERNRIAREIHDNVGHLLSRSILLTGAVKAVNRDPGLSESLNSLDESLNLAMDSIRTSVHDLHDEAVDLDQAVRTVIQDFTFCPVSYSYDCGRGIPREVKYSFISIIKEALSNIMRHSDATRASITIREHPAIYQLCVEDNGTSAPVLPGTDTEPPGMGRTGMGLSNMRERTARLGGYFHIFQDHGFKILITIPKEKTI